jgi:hypothetical protein
MSLLESQELRSLEKTDKTLEHTLPLDGLTEQKAFNSVRVDAMLLLVYGTVQRVAKSVGFEQVEEERVARALSQ